MKKKTLIIFIIFVTLINTIMPVLNAMQIITKANLINDHSIKTHIKQENKNGWFEVICNYICYKEENNKYPAYCIMPGTHGVDEEGSYTVTVNKLLKDKLIYNTLINGYPYKTPTQLGVENADDAYVATKLALKSVLLQRDIKEQYKAIDERGEKIINAMCNIANNGINGNMENEEPCIAINKIGTFSESGDYYYQEYNVSANVNISEYNINSISKFPTEAYITDKDGTKKEKFSANEKFRVMIPKNQLDKNISGEINITASCNTKPIFYGEAPNSKIQDYAVTYKPYVDYTTSTTLDISTNNASIKIIKKDEETSKPIKDVEFALYNKEDEYITSKKTNQEGIVEFNNLYQGKYKVKETNSNIDYVKDDTVYEFTTEYNKQIVKTITNKHKKGSLKVLKVDKDNNDNVLEGIEFDLINSDNQIVAHLVTDSNGEAVVNNINIGKYTLKETKTKEIYNLCIDENIEVNWNEITNIKIENEKKKGQIKIIKQDAENNLVKLKGVEFEIIDSNNQIVDKITTDVNGEAVSKKLPIGKYKIKETNLGENSQYILEDKEYEITVEDEKIVSITIENIHKKGNLKIIKVDKDDKTITLGAIEFDLLDKDGNIVAHLVTDVNGEAYIENINIGKYTLKETKTKREYNLCENENIIVEWNKTSETVIENEKKKGQIKIIKQDAEKQEIKLKGVKFQIIDVNNKVVEEIETKDNGEAVSSKLLIGEYKIREIDLGNNVQYLLNNNIYNVQVENQTIAEIVIKNEHKKGNLKIIKVDKDNSKIALEGVEFEITDEDGFIYKEITNKNGIAEIEDIRVGKIRIKEIKTDEKYILSKFIYEAEIKYDDTIEIKIENEKKKGQVEVYKTDKENNNIKIPGVEFEILDINNIVVDKIITNENGYAISKKLPIGEYYLKEVKTNSNYILNTEIIKFIIKQEETTTLNIKNEKIKGKIKIIKTSSNDSNILDIKKGDYLSDVTFDIYNSSGKLVDTLVTDENGQAISKDLEIGRYKVIEKTTNKYYILNVNEQIVNIERNNEVKVLEIQNEAVIPNLDIEKNGMKYAERNEEIKYDFDIKNASNTKLDNFTWTEYIPYEDCKITKMITGTYNEELEYEVYYKTNKSDYILLKKANSLINEYINFDEIILEEKEVITQIKVEYKTVSKDFTSLIKPNIYVKLDNDLKKDEKIVNKTKLSGNFEEYIIEDDSITETTIIEKEVIKKLPKTGY